ncbi:urease accessory protein UreE [Phormidium tenue FACHB-886]|nr:urease accessory protein UreE [Phormidium tenue FACHB-886]
MTLNLITRIASNQRSSASAVIQLALPLTAEERTRSRHYFPTETGQDIYLQLPRGTVLQHGDLLTTEDGKTIVQVIAKPEPVMTATAQTPIALLRAAYHLGNRHVPLEVTIDYLRLAPDPVLKAMLEQLGLQVTEALLPFQPEAGAYGHSHEPSSHRHPPKPES